VAAVPEPPEPVAPEPATVERQPTVSPQPSPADPDSPFAADIYLRLAEFHLALGHLRPAAGAFRRVVDHPHSTLAQKQDAVWQLEQCYSKLFEWDEALKISRRIQSDFPTHPKTSYLQLEIGYILKEMGQHAQAIAALQKVLEWADGEDAAEARLYIGEAHQHIGDYRKAIEAFYEVAYYGADASTQWINTADFQRARCHEKLNEIDQARSVYRRIIQREGGGSEWGRLARESVDLLPSSPRGR
jgi:tetratricopeptide (TPR) repeat protein